MGLSAVKRLFAAVVGLCLIATTALAFYQSRDSNYNKNVTSGGGGGSASYAALYGDAQNIGFGSATYTSPVKTWPAGTAFVLLYDAIGAAPYTIFTIQGATATQIGATVGRCSLWRAAVSGGVGSVVVVATGTFSEAATAGGVVTTTTPTPSASQVANMAGAPEPQAVVTAVVPASGVGIVVAAGQGGGAFTASWTGATRDSVTEAQIATGNGATIAGASTTSAGSTTPGVTTTTGDFNFIGANGCMGIATWSP